ncbi:MAG: restriction endonuclease, partial [Bacteroidetes bacterium]|nr:restriction endonuclease [Bacteroidota bacterium]
SILKDAFSGKLVPQDPSDPPASLLLEKIKAEKEKLAKEPKTEKSDKRTGREVAGEDKAERAKVNSSKRKTMGTR